MIFRMDDCKRDETATDTGGWAFRVSRPDGTQMVEVGVTPAAMHVLVAVGLAALLTLAAWAGAQ